MRTVSSERVTEAVRDLALRINRELPADVLAAFHRAAERETSPVGKSVLARLIENAEIARTEAMPLCQDTGLAVLFVELGREARIEGDLTAALHEGVRRGYREGYLRCSAADPLSRKNTGDNTPAIIHYDFVAGDRLTISLLAKGGGSENMSAMHMLRPAQGLAGVKQAVLDTVSKAGANPCPPITVGVGLGGAFELAAINAKKSLLRELGSKNPDPELEALEQDWLAAINRLGIGPAGFGGRTTALGVHIIKAPCHLASLPVVVNVQCHAARHGRVEL